MLRDRVSQIEQSEERHISPAVSASLDILLLQLYMAVEAPPQSHPGRTSSRIEVKDKALQSSD